MKNTRRFCMAARILPDDRMNDLPENARRNKHYASSSRLRVGGR
ncbi:hypothetical protein [Paenibacillus sp. sgz500958]